MTVKLRDYISFNRFRSDPAQAVEEGAERAWRWSFIVASIGVFFALLALFVYVTTTVSVIIVQLLAALAAGLMVRAILPTGQFREWSQGYATGEAGNRWRRRVESALGWTKRRLHRTLSILPGVSGPN